MMIHPLADDMYEADRQIVTGKATGRACNPRVLEGEDHLLSDNSEAASEQYYSGESLTSSPRDWFAAYAMSRHEKRIASHCERIGIEHTSPHPREIAAAGNSCDRYTVSRPEVRRPAIHLRMEGWAPCK